MKFDLLLSQRKAILAGAKMVFAHLLQAHVSLCAVLAALIAAGRKAATRFGIDGTAHLTSDRHDLAVTFRNARNGNCGKKCLGIGMGWIVKKLLRRCMLHALT